MKPHRFSSIASPYVTFIEMITQVTPSNFIGESGTQRSPSAKPTPASSTSMTAASRGDSASPACTPMAL